VAGMVGMEYVFCQYQVSNFIDSLTSSITSYDGMRNWIFEYPVLSKLRDRVNYILVGDEVFGWTRGTLNTERDMLRAIFIYHLADLNVWSTLLNRENMYDILVWHSEHVLATISQRSALTDLHDRKDYFYASERLFRNLLPARYFISNYVEVISPWLDNDILDFMRHVPTDLRKDKVLFRMTATALFPDLYTVPIATSMAQQTAAEKRHCRARNLYLIQRAVLDGEYPIDQIFDRDALATYTRSKEPLMSKVKGFLVEAESPLLRKVLYKTHGLVLRLLPARASLTHFLDV